MRLSELWAYRELLYFFVWRNLKVRYRQTLFGVAWAILQPFLMMVVFSLVLGHFAHLPSDGLPYPVFVYAGLVPWTLFSRALVGASESLTQSGQLITKVYFPRLMLPLADAASYLVDFTVALAFLAGMMLLYRLHLTIAFLLVPLFGLAALVTALAVGVWLSAINVKYRDVPLVVPFIVQFWLFATPVAYPISLFPANIRFALGFNPVAGIVEGFRWALLGTPGPGAVLPISLGVSLAVFFAGVLYFRRAERLFADWI